MAFSTGYDMTMKMKFGDGLGKTYTAIAIVWTIILSSASFFLVWNRNLPFLRIRNVPLTISAVATLHVYWVLCLLAYGLNGHFPCGTEFWIMNIYLPFGIALFHASNSQLLYIAAIQRRYAGTETPLDEKHGSNSQARGWRRHLEKLKARKAINRTMTYIGFGMLAQFVCALILFCTSKRFNSFGIFGPALTDSPTDKIECRRGLEWLPSIFWQFFWAWIYAPYLLWKVRDIHDVHAWRIQTVCCCVAGLPASPMWLLALYLPQMSRADRYFIAPLWFAPSICLMEAFMIFVPCWQIVKNRKLKNDTLLILDEWERQNNGTSFESDSTKINTASRLSHKSSLVSTTSSRRAQSHLYTMVALEKALRTNPTPLLLFAALKDFSGENISFLNHVQEWKNGWKDSQRYSSILHLPAPLTSEAKLLRRQFNKAVEIYSSFVSLKYSSFPINISHSELKQLQVVFEDSAALVNAGLDNQNTATPFDDWNARAPKDIEYGMNKDAASTISTVADTNNSMDDFALNLLSTHGSVVETYQMKSIGDRLPTDTPIPSNFGPGIFDQSVESIKYTVLTNTWPKFVNAGCANNLEKNTAMAKLRERFSEYRTGWSRLFSA